MTEKNKILETRKKFVRRIKKKKPKFRRPQWKTRASVSLSWRRPKGIHSKLRERRGGKGKVPAIGYGTPKIIKGLHPSGYEEVLIHTPAQITLIDGKTQAIRIGSSVGKRKRADINELAIKKGVKVLNP